MNQLRIVIDTNVLVSSVLIHSSIPDLAFKKARTIGILLFSNATLQALEEILNRAKFDQYVSRSVRTQFLAKLKLDVEIIIIKEILQECRDAKDDNFLELAISGDATHIITGDQDLLELHPFRGVAIITPSQFLEL